MADDPFYKVTTDHFNVTFILGAEDDPATVGDVDAIVTLPDKSRWSTTFMTMPEIQKNMDRWRATGEYSGGDYFHCPDLVIVRQAGIPGMVDILKRAIADGDHLLILTPLEQPDEDELLNRVAAGQTEASSASFQHDPPVLPNRVDSHLV